MSCGEQVVNGVIEQGSIGIWGSGSGITMGMGRVLGCPSRSRERVEEGIGVPQREWGAVRGVPEGMGDGQGHRAGELEIWHSGFRTGIRDGHGNGEGLRVARREQAGTGVSGALLTGLSSVIH